MSDPTRTTGATAQQIESAAERHWNAKNGTFDLATAKAARGYDSAIGYHHEDATAWAEALIPEDQCIVPRSFVAAVDAAISKAEELDYSPPYIRIPLGKWHDVENARDTFREGLR